MRGFRIIVTVVTMLLVCGIARLQNDTTITYYVSPAGDDANDGLTAAGAFRTITQAWNSIPQNIALTQGYTIAILPGTYTAEESPTYWESRYGTDIFPIIIHAAEGRDTVYLPSINLFDGRYITFRDLNIEVEEGDPFHCEKCDHVILEHNIIRGANPDTFNTQEAVKFNQSQYIDILGNDISGAWDNAIDFVAVQYGNIVGNHIHNAGDWCAYAKGGSAYIRVINNEIFDCGTGGFTVGQGTGFQFMTPPWTQYEAYAVLVWDNIIHDVAGAGVGVQGGYNVLITDNIMYRVGERSHAIEVGYGLRSCDGEEGEEGRERCAEYREAGGWGNDLVDTEGDMAVRIPNKNVYIINNVVYNPADYRTQHQHFFIASPYEGASQDNSNLGPVLADDNLQIKGNVIWNGDASMLLGIEESDTPAGCRTDNPTCNAAQLAAENDINTVEPQLASPETGDYTYTNRATSIAFEIPAFPAWDVPVPEAPPDFFSLQEPMTTPVE